MKAQPPSIKVVPDRVYDTPGLRVQRYWQRHPERAFLLMSAMMAKNVDPEKFVWPQMQSQGKTVKSPSGRYEFKISKEKPMFRKPPQLNQGGCPMCGGVRYSLGWHTDWDGLGVAKRGWWHVACSTAFLLMTKPNEFVDYFKRKQGGMCGISGDSLDGVVVDMDHIIPLYRVHRDYAHLPAGDLVKFWGPRNLRAITNKSHKDKNRFEAKERAGHFDFKGLPPNEQQ